MSRYIARTEKPQVYERILPAEQIKVMGHSILSSVTPLESEISTDTRRKTWLSGDGKFYRIELRSLDAGVVGAPIKHYLVDQFDAVEPKMATQPMYRFIASDVAGNKDRTTSIYNSSNAKIEDVAEQTKVSREMLAALIDLVDSGVAWDAVNGAMDERFIGAIGDYLMSEVLSKNISATPVDTWRAAMDYSNVITDAAKAVVDEVDLGDAHRSAVLDAVQSTPRAFVQDRYTSVNILEVLAEVESDIN